MVVIGFTDIYPESEQFGNLPDGQQFKEINQSSYVAITPYIHVYPLSGSYDEALFFYVDFGLHI